MLRPGAPGGINRNHHGEENTHSVVNERLLSLHILPGAFEGRGIAGESPGKKCRREADSRARDAKNPTGVDDAFTARKIHAAAPPIARENKSW
jgi:hypothetical protein